MKLLFTCPETEQVPLQSIGIMQYCTLTNPMPINKTEFIQIMTHCDYAAEPGFCVNTLYCGMTGMIGGIEQQLIKHTAESTEKLFRLPENKLFLGYNDAALQSDLPQLLQKHLPDRCQYESHSHTLI